MKHTMQAFYHWLTHHAEVHDPRLEALARLTQAGPAEIAALENGLSWDQWTTEPTAG